MNNLTFGDESMGYYETIAGGAGAGPSWHGCSGVHTHMTNTRITDPEILERRYPVILREFSLRKGSGGDGACRGGDGVVRELEFTKDLIVSVLTERRAFQPYGMAGGQPGARGMNVLKRCTNASTDCATATGSSDGPAVHAISLGGKNTVEVSKGDRLVIMTPGGGGFGSKTDSDVLNGSNKRDHGIAIGSDGGSIEDDTCVKKRQPLPLDSGSLSQYTRDQESA